MDEGSGSFDYDDYYCNSGAYDAYDEVYADIQFEPYFNSDPDTNFYPHIDIEIEHVDNGRNSTGSEEVEVYIEDGDGGDVHQDEFGLGRYDGDVYEDIQIGGPVTVDWVNQAVEDENTDDDYVEDELVEDEDASSSLSRLMLDGARAVVEHLERSLLDQLENAVVEKLESWLCSLDFSMIPSVKSWPLFRGERSSSSSANIGNEKGEVAIGSVDKGKELVQSQTGTFSCPICMELCTIDAEHIFCCLPCGHVYGMSCIKRWLQLQNPGKCPQCKNVCKLEDVRTLYGSFAVVDKNFEEKIRVLEAKCASLELKLLLCNSHNIQDSKWEKKAAELQQRRNSQGC